MYQFCKNCGREIRVMAFRGTDWCSDNCRKVLLGKAKCSYEEMFTSEGDLVDVCTVHGFNSKYPPYRGEHRPCLAVEPY